MENILGSAKCDLWVLCLSFFLNNYVFLDRSTFKYFYMNGVLSQLNCLRHFGKHEAELETLYCKHRII
jgi:hypothetical protein